MSRSFERLSSGAKISVHFFQAKGSDKALKMNCLLIKSFGKMNIYFFIAPKILYSCQIKVEWRLFVAHEVKLPRKPNHRHPIPPKRIQIHQFLNALFQRNHLTQHPLGLNPSTYNHV